MSTGQRQKSVLLSYKTPAVLEPAHDGPPAEQVREAYRKMIEAKKIYDDAVQTYHLLLDKVNNV